MPAVTLRPARPDDAAAEAAIWSAGWCDGHLGHVPDALAAVRTDDSFGTRAAQRIADTTVAERLVGAGGHDRAWLAVATGNGRARRFYERQGWVDEGPFDYPAAAADGPVAVPCHRYVKPVA